MNLSLNVNEINAQVPSIYEQLSPVLTSKVDFFAKSIYLHLNLEKYVSKHLNGSIWSNELLYTTFSIMEFKNSLEGNEEQLVIFWKDFIPVVKTIGKSLEIFNEVQILYIKILENGDKLENHQGDLHDIYKNKIKELPKGQKIILYGGVSNHGFLFEITHQENGEFSFKIINTGLGATRFSQNYTRTLIYENLPLEAFFKKGIYDVITNCYTKNLDINQVYNTIDSNLNQNNNKVYGRWHKLQNSGNCAFKSFSCWLHEMIAPGLTSESRSSERELIYLKFKLFKLNQDKELLTLNAVREHLEAIALYEKHNSLLGRWGIIIDKAPSPVDQKEIIKIFEKAIDEKEKSITNKCFDLEEKLNLRVNWDLFMF